MQLQPRPRPEQALRVSAKLITSSTILQYSSDELERAVNQEQMDNPTLEVEEQRICSFCGTRLYGQTCTTCGHFAQSASAVSDIPINYEISVDPLWSTHAQFYDFDNYGFA